MPVLVIGHGVANLAGGGSFDSASDRVVYGAVQVLAGLAIAAGLWLSAGSRVPAVALVAAGAIAISAIMPWFVVFTVPMGLLLCALAYRGRPVDGG